MNTVMSRIFTKPFLVTIFRYALVAAGGWIIANGYLDEGTWETVSGALLVIAVALMGGADSVKDKANIAGKSVAAENLPNSVRNELEAAARAAPKRTLADILFGK